MSSSPDITQLLLDWSAGDDQALEELSSLLFDELHRIAHRYMRRERPSHLLQTTALINEAYVRLIDCRRVRWQNRAQFFGVAARLMRRILVDFARSRSYAKRGGSRRQVISLSDVPAVSQDRARELLALDDALQALSVLDARKSQIVELRFFGGLTVEETAEVLSVSTRTVLREWDLAKAWLSRELNAGKAS